MRLFLFTLWLLLASCVTLNAQTPATGKREVGLQFSGFNSGSSFSAFYKKELRENVYRRWRILAGNLQVIDNDGFVNLNFSAAIAVGREKRRALDDKLAFYRGPEFGLGLGYAVETDNDRLVVTPRFGYVLGLQHQFNARWAINIETIPSVAVNVTVNTADFEGGGWGASATATNQVSLGVLRIF